MATERDAEANADASIITRLEMSQRTIATRDHAAAFAGRARTGLLGGSTPPVEVLISGPRALVWQKIRGRLRLVDLSRTPSGTFLRGVHPISEMARKNGQLGVCGVS